MLGLAPMLATALLVTPPPAAKAALDKLVNPLPLPEKLPETFTPPCPLVMTAPGNCATWMAPTKFVVLRFVRPAPLPAKAPERVTPVELVSNTDGFINEARTGYR